MSGKCHVTVEEVSIGATPCRCMALTAPPPRPPLSSSKSILKKEKRKERRKDGTVEKDGDKVADMKAEKSQCFIYTLACSHL